MLSKGSALLGWVFTFSFFAVASQAHADYVPAPDSQVLLEIAPGSTQEFSQHLSVLVWNVHKGSDGERWAQDLRKLSENRSLIMIQEGMEDSFMPQVLRSLPSLGWLMARSFFMEPQHTSTGVITGSPQTPLSSVFLRSRDVEPVVRTPKMALLTTYQMEGGVRLLAVNIHAINFTTLAAFNRQIDDVMGMIENWQGKVVLAGDFNTWAQGRTDYLMKKAAAAGLQQVVFQKDPRTLVLDHIFLRGCTAESSAIHSDVRTSDHAPLSAELLCSL